MKAKKELTPTELEMVEQLAQEAAVEAAVEAVEETVDAAVDEAVTEALDEAIAELTEESAYDEGEDEEKVDDDLAARVAALEERIARILEMLEGGESEEKALKPRVVKRASRARETEIELSDLLPELKAWGQERRSLFGRPLRGGVK